MEEETETYLRIWNGNVEWVDVQSPSASEINQYAKDMCPNLILQGVTYNVYPGMVIRVATYKSKTGQLAESAVFLAGPALWDANSQSPQHELCVKEKE